MTDILCDTNVLLDIATRDPVWAAWSETQLRAAASSGRVWINPVIYAELAPAFIDESSLDRWLDPALFARAPLPYSAAWRAAEAFMAYRRAGGKRTSPLPDFFIGAHAESEGHTVLTRDGSRFQSYFPRVPLIKP